MKYGSGVFFHLANRWLRSGFEKCKAGDATV